MTTAGQRIFRVGRATSTDGKEWSTTQTVWSSDGARLPPSPPNTDGLHLTDFATLGSCQLLELRHRSTASGTVLQS